MNVNPATQAPPRAVFTALAGFPEVLPGADLVSLLADALRETGITLLDGDILVLASKIVAKAEGRLVDLGQVKPGPRAIEVAGQTGKDPRLVELILGESDVISRMRPGLLIVRHKLGFTSANAGIDHSNVCQPEGSEMVLLLPEAPDASAAALRSTLRERLGADVGIVIADSHGRPFRLGTVGVALGVAGLPALWDRRGDPDRQGVALEYTEVGTADEIAAAAGLLMGQAGESMPVVHIRGLSLPPIQGRAADLIRPRELDVYL
ncbi:MAG: coenzyme F420-0:L-glutamate ligase [Candidatus Promineifilaceae bacterium]|jgi:coenzyme F420-0:L-glutamate ligase/coenzyme F420-1:gamma-L-glutamate ligase